MNKIKELIEKHEGYWKTANDYIKLEQFECYNPQQYKILIQKLYTGEIGKREFVGQLLDLERDQYFLFSYVDNLLGNFCDLNFMDTWDLAKELILFVAPHQIIEVLISDWSSSYTTEEFESSNFTTKEEILEWIFNPSEEMLEYLYKFKQELIEQDALFK